MYTGDGKSLKPTSHIKKVGYLVGYFDHFDSITWDIQWDISAFFGIGKWDISGCPNAVFPNGKEKEVH